MDNNKKYTQTELYRAYNFSKKNKDSLIGSISCGCFTCETLFLANDIRDWVINDDGQLTAICPYCEADTVIGDSVVYPLKKDFLRAMKKIWH